MEGPGSRRVSGTVDRIESLITEVAQLQRPYVTRVCLRCAKPCCTRVHYLFTEKDILYLKLSGRGQRWRREGFMKMGCWFLGSAGCTLDLHSRPFLCHSYICAALEAAIHESDPMLMDRLRERFRIIGMLRSQMWSEYLEACL